MSKITLDLRINGLDFSGHELVVSINGYKLSPMNSHTKQPEETSCINFGTFMENEIAYLLSCQRVRSAEIHKSVLHSFMQYRYDVDIPLESVTVDEIERFEAYLKSRNLSKNTISFNMRVLRSSYNKAIRKYNVIDKQPFKNVYTGIVATDKRALDINDIKSIKLCKLISKDDCFARDLFMFSFYTRGMSFVDIAYLKRENIRNGYLNYKRHKTGQKISIKWEACMQEIVDRNKQSSSDYLLPIIHLNNGRERNQYRGVQSKVNKSLKRIASKCGIVSNLTMYVARHSWANAAQYLNQPLELISFGMGHSSTKTTKIYLRSNKMSQIDQMNSAILHEIGAF